MSLVTVRKGNLFASGCEALVNPVNCVGVHGKGLALEFMKRWPEAVGRFSRLCKRGEVAPGFVTSAYLGSNPRFILFFPTKDRWRDPSKLEYIQQGLEDLILVVQDLEIDSVAIPALGCGLGGLPWFQVLPLLIEAGRRMLVRVDIFEPGGRV